MPLVLLIAVAMFLLVLLSVVAVVSAAGPKACCVSRKLSGVMLTASGTHRHGAKMIDINDDVLEFHYDWDERETVVIATSFNTTTGKSHTSTIRLDYKFSTSYISTEGGHCYRQDLDPKDMQEPCFAANFTYRGSRTIGAGAEGVRVNGYVGQFHGDDVKILVTADGDCMPVSYMAYGEHGQVRLSQSYLYTNLKKWVDPKLFGIPRNCMNAQKIPATKRALEELTGLHIRIPF